MTLSKIFQHNICRIISVMIVCLTAIISINGAEAQMLHLVIAADNNAAGGVGDIAMIDQQNIKRLFEANIPQKQLHIEVLTNDGLKKENLLKFIDDLKISNEDTVVFYYSGHGAYDAANQMQILQISTGDMYRNDITERIKQKSARLSVILTDCCNVKVEPMAKKRQVSEKFFAKEMSPLFGSLFIYCKGTVDITSSKIGEFSGCDNRKIDNRGSCFTYPFVEILQINRDNAQMDWKKIVDELSVKTNNAFRESFPNGVQGQMTQTVVAFDFPGKFIIPVPNSPAEIGGEKKGYRFGVRATPNKDGGMKMLEIITDSPAQRSGLEAGDIITEINGKPINTEKEYSDAVDSSDKVMNVKLINIRDGKVMSAVITLGW
ncbi:MAG: PDZ domain-containing protein [Planctomycetaceae bacterium]|jgi:hypothetical protein|nr:PDZ domain-containing protein [Planctomycetaceae bacterium]